jgi:hypothetical protein
LVYIYIFIKYNKKIIIYYSYRRADNAACESSRDDEAEVEGTQDLNMTDLENNNDDDNNDDPPKQVETNKEENEANHADSSHATTLPETLPPLSQHEAPFLGLESETLSLHPQPHGHPTQ